MMCKKENRGQNCQKKKALSASRLSISTTGPCNDDDTASDPPLPPIYLFSFLIYDLLVEG